MDIRSTAQVFFILGDPISQVRTHTMFNAFFAERGIDAVFVPLHVSTADVTRVVEGLRGIQNFGGLVATVPHKQEIVGLCDQLEDGARQVQAVNAVRPEADGRLFGDIFDGKGFVAGLASKGHTVAGAKALLLGAGGAATAIAFALFDAGLGELVIHNRTQERAEALAGHLLRNIPAAKVSCGEADTEGCDLVINSTSLGMKPDDPLPIAPAMLRKGLLVAEIIMTPTITPLLAEARRRGCVCHEGIHMLECQRDLLARFFRLVS